MSRLVITFEDDKGQWCTFADAARYLDVTRARITQLAKSGMVRSIEIGRSKLAFAPDIIGYGNVERKPGRKPKDA